MSEKAGGASPADAATLSSEHEGTPGLSLTGPDDPAGPLPLTSRYDAPSEMLGRGGMGEVFLVHDRWLGRDIAMKALRTDRAHDEHSKAMFVREARIQGQLEHPAIVPVYDLSRNGDGTTYFTMKRIRGQTLRSVLDDSMLGEATSAGKYSTRRLLAALSSVALAVHFAHSRGVLHRDLKPSNLLLGDFGEVYVLDWGIADRITPEAGGQSGPEQRYVCGAPGYMSPEQCRNEPLTVRSDVFALGAILFEMLSLRRLVEGDERTDRIALTLDGVDARASVRAPEREVPPELEALCLEATALNPDERLPDARAFHEALERFLDGEKNRDLRRRLATEHTRRAKEMAESVFASSHEDTDSRKAALREVGRALAFDPASHVALTTLSDLLTRPPRTIPGEAKASIAEGRSRAHAANLRWGAFSYFAWGISLLTLGGDLLERPRLTLFTMLVLAALSALCFVRMKEAWSDRLQLVAIWLSVVAVVLTSQFFGSLLLTPIIAIANMVGLATRPWQKSHHTRILFAGCASIVVPILLELTGLAAQTLVVRDGVLTMIGPLGKMGSHTVSILSAGYGVLIVLLCGITIGDARRRQAESERALHLQAWQLRQIAPPSRDLDVEERS